VTQDPDETQVVALPPTTGAGASQAPSPPRRSAPLAGFLSFVWPGLGQWYTDHPRRAIVFAIPVAAATLLLVAQLFGGLETLAVRLLTPAFAFTLLLLVIGLCAWRLLAIADAATLAGGRSTWRDRGTLATVGILGLVTILVHGYVGYAAWSFYDAGNRIFIGEPGPSGPPASGAPSPTASDDFVATPIATPTSADARVNVLLTGIDASEQRTTRLTDTIIVASIDPKTGSIAMVSFPRDLARFELADGRIFNGKINELMATAARNPDAYPDGPFPTLISTVGHLLGVPIHYYGAVNLDGFVRMVDLAGGIDVVNQRAISDPAYGGWTDGRPVGFHLPAGPHHLDGQEALAYARSRKGAGDNDFTRARRQQEVLLALRKRVLDPLVLPRLPELVQAAGDTVNTNFPPDRLADMLEVAQSVDEASVRQVVLGPRRYATNPPLSESGGRYILVPKMEAIAALSVELFGADSRYATTAAPSPSPSPSPAPIAVP
jgi:LCP family protein required for cell wall assembly